MFYVTGISGEEGDDTEVRDPRDSALHMGRKQSICETPGQCIHENVLNLDGLATGPGSLGWSGDSVLEH